jgi:hypothetical protein
MFTQIHLVSIRLDGSHNAGEGRYKLRSRPDVGEFLGEHPLAKIVIVVDTHCLQETGGLIWEGAGQNVNACSLWEVGDGYCMRWPLDHAYTGIQLLKDCLPEELTPYISKSQGTHQHFHRSIIINLACGASIRDDESRNKILEG